MEKKEAFGSLVTCLCHNLDYNETNIFYQTKVNYFFQCETIGKSLNFLKNAQYLILQQLFLSYTESKHNFKDPLEKWKYKNSSLESLPSC